MKGVYAAIVTHFDDQLQVDHDAVAAEVSRLIAAGVHGIVPNGTVGEGGSLTREERRAAVETSVAAAGQAPVCAGISAATAEQAAETAAKWFAGQRDLVLVTVDGDTLGDKLRWEPSRGGALFPHLYGELSVKDVLRVDPLPLGEDGAHAFPRFFC